MTTHDPAAAVLGRRRAVRSRARRHRLCNWGLMAAGVAGVAVIAVLCAMVLSGPNGTMITVRGDTAGVILAFAPIAYLLGSFPTWRTRRRK